MLPYMNHDHGFFVLFLEDLLENIRYEFICMGSLVSLAFSSSLMIVHDFPIKIVQNSMKK